MEIPHHDISTTNNYKQLYTYMPDSCFRMLTCTRSGSGKTNTLIHMLLKDLRKKILAANQIQLIVQLLDL